jgi:hypothetical protein
LPMPSQGNKVTPRNEYKPLSKIFVPLFSDLPPPSQTVFS